MGGFAFILVLVVYTLVLYWYAMNHERDTDGKAGLLGIREYDPDGEAPQTKKVLRRGHALIKVRGRLPEGTADETPLDRVRGARTEVEAVRAKAEQSDDRPTRSVEPLQRTFPLAPQSDD